MLSVTEPVCAGLRQALDTHMSKQVECFFLGSGKNFVIEPTPRVLPHVQSLCLHSGVYDEVSDAIYTFLSVLYSDSI